MEAWAAWHLSEQALKIRRIDHVSINVTDAARSYAFYGRILGLKQLQTVDCGEFDITYFALPDGGRLELFDYHGKNAPHHREESDAGLRHLAFEVEDVATHEKLLEGRPRAHHPAHQRAAEPGRRGCCSSWIPTA